MRRFAVIFLVAVGIVAALGYYQPILGFVELLFDRPHQNLSDEELQAEIAATESVLDLLNRQAMGLASRPAATANVQALRDTMAGADKTDGRLRQLRAELSFRADQTGYLLLAGFAIAFIVFFYFFRDAYLSARPGQRDREKIQVQLARDQRESNLTRDRTLLTERLGRIDSRLLRVQIGQSDYRKVTEALGQPVGSEQDRGVVTLHYIFDALDVPPGEEAAKPERVPVLILLREGVVSEIKILAAPDSRF